MANASPTRVGAINGASDKTAIFLKVFAGEIIMEFERRTKLLDKHMVISIDHGKSAQFPAIGSIPDAAYHTPGAELTGQTVYSAERIITIDGLLLVNIFLASIDEAMSHFQVRGKYAAKMAQRLALTFDNHVARELIIAARTSTELTTGDNNIGGTVTNEDLASTNVDSKLQAWSDAIYDAAIELDEKFVPDEDRYCLLAPADYRFLAKAVQSSGWSAIHKDYGGKGSYADGNIVEIAGIKLISHPLIPSTDLSGETYHGVDASVTKGIVFTPDAVGTVKLMDLAMDVQYDARRQGTLLVAKYAMGHGVLKADCAVELRTEAPS